MKRWLAVLMVVAAGAAHGAELSLPSTAQQVIARDTSNDRYLAPTGPAVNGVVPTQVIDGAVARSAWRIDVAGITPLQLVAPLRSQLEDAGYRIVLDCAAEACGGYDFRFATEVLPAPDMYVNIRNYHMLTALRDGAEGGAEAVTVLASGSSGASFLQIIQAGAQAQVSQLQTVGDAPAPDAPTRTAPSGPLGAALSDAGHVVLEGLDFQSGTSDLGEGPFAVLQELHDVLRANPDMRVVLVGHTDNIGGLEGNIALSINRARAVRNRLIDRYGIRASRLEAQGMGYLAPHTTNQSRQGREANRRVEAVLLAL